MEHREVRPGVLYAPSFSLTEPLPQTDPAVLGTFQGLLSQPGRTARVLLTQDDPPRSV